MPLTDGTPGYALALQKDGKIVMAGSHGSYTFFALARLTPGGTLDASFDGDGKAITDIGGVDTAWGLAIQPDGKIVAAGQRNNSSTPDDAIALVRYHDAVRLYVQQDANFNVTAVTDSAGVVLERYVYEPYGSFTVLNADWTIDQDGQSDNGQLHLHQGGRYDAVSGTYHFQRRDYSPSLGRWVQQDPWGYVDGMSLYEYVRSGPTQSVDPTGWITVDTDNRDIRAAYETARASAAGRRLFQQIEDMEPCTGEVIINIVARSSNSSEGQKAETREYLAMRGGAPVLVGDKSKARYLLLINPLHKLLPSESTTATDGGLRAGTPLDALVIHEARHIWQHMREDMGGGRFDNDWRIWDGKEAYKGQWTATGQGAYEYDAVGHENEYLQETSAGYQRIGHGLPPDQEGRLEELKVNQYDGMFVIGQDLLDWPVFPGDEKDYKARLTRGRLTRTSVRAAYFWLPFFVGGQDKLDALLRPAI